MNEVQECFFSFFYATRKFISPCTINNMKETGWKPFFDHCIKLGAPQIFESVVQTHVKDTKLSYRNSECLEVKKSRIEGGGEGLFAKSNLKANMVLGSKIGRYTNDVSRLSFHYDPSSSFK